VFGFCVWCVCGVRVCVWCVVWCVVFLCTFVSCVYVMGLLLDLCVSFMRFVYFV